MRKGLWLQRFLPVEGDDTVELVLDERFIVFEIARAPGGRFVVHMGEVPADAELDLDELRRLLDRAREILIESGRGD